jgi:hypothetical protein
MSSDEWALPCDVGVVWCADTSDPLLVQEAGNALLMVPPHPDDPDRRNVALRVKGCSDLLLGSPGRDARSSHRLWERGLRGCEWAAEVSNSRWVAAQAVMDPCSRRLRSKWAGDRTHWIFLFAEATVECVGSSLTVGRLESNVEVVWLA